jgi:perosamine synthetase
MQSRLMNDRFISSLGFLLDKFIIENRSKIMEELSLQKICSNVYNPQPVPRMKYYKNKHGYKSADYINAEQISDGMIALPAGPHLDRDDMLGLSDTIKKIIGGISV